MAGKEGKYGTSRNLKERLARELLTNVALRVSDTADTDVFVVFGRGGLHLTLLLENIRRAGYAMAASRPRVVVRQSYGVEAKPWVDKMWGYLRDVPSSRLSERMYQSVLPNSPPLPEDRPRPLTYFTLWANVA